MSEQRVDKQAPPWRATVVTLFPEMFPGPLGFSLAGKALKKAIWSLETVDIRDFASHKHRSVDDAPFGGGPGMVMRPDVLAAAVDQAVAAQAGGANVPVIYLSPRGRRMDQRLVLDLAAKDGVIAICGRYEGVDERVLETRGITEVSIGDFVLSGGELAALSLLDATIRLLPGVIGEPEALREESFARGLLEYPHYTRPQEWEGREVPEVLLSGHHENINAWRQRQAESLTRQRRPDLWERYDGAGKSRG
jgi:tRNA (guanine37-N1)-methyltransferase